MNRTLSIACLQYSSAKNEKDTLKTIKDLINNFPKFFLELNFANSPCFGFLKAANPPPNNAPLTPVLKYGDANIPAGIASTGAAFRAFLPNTFVIFLVP